MSDNIQRPLHPSIIPRLDPEYLKFHNDTLQYIIPPHTLPWDPSIRDTPTIPGGSEPVHVGIIRDIELTHARFRSYTPEGRSPVEGWPVFIYFHGGAVLLANRSLCMALITFHRWMDIGKYSYRSAVRDQSLRR
jgi:hypothetical protein